LGRKTSDWWINVPGVNDWGGKKKTATFRVRVKPRVSKKKGTRESKCWWELGGFPGEVGGGGRTQTQWLGRMASERVPPKSTPNGPEKRRGKKSCGLSELSPETKGMGRVAQIGKKKSFDRARLGEITRKGLQMILGVTGWSKTKAVCVADGKGGGVGPIKPNKMSMKRKIPKTNESEQRGFGLESAFRRIFVVFGTAKGRKMKGGRLNENTKFQKPKGCQTEDQNEQRIAKKTKEP